MEISRLTHNLKERHPMEQRALSGQVRSEMLRRALTVSPRRLTRLAAATQPAPERVSPEEDMLDELGLPEPQPQPERWIPVRPGRALLQRLGLQPAGWLSEEPDQSRQ
ncbi:hypothetical protein FJT64_027297 [Amphibalanus amphitrite]|uniref:Uncharacterized protein n=1 Tax=Amphibalanus amphitrite TaxID=1232801 RepID=A0A6A4W482_AMPAM|nr:hypothetical protein FJT64_027297 [Amphibalanus amphitrite]